jgi:hypothetical protein
MQNLFQFIMYIVFGKRWLHFDLKHGYKATLFINELELDMHKTKLSAVQKEKREMQEELKALEERPNLTDEEYTAMIPEDQEKNPKALYEIKKKVNGERAEQITVLKNRVKQMDDEIATANGELQKGFAMTYQNRLKYDFIKSYKIKKTYAENK